jgi:uncharacterized protein involved in outer membrane biogenesis
MVENLQAAFASGSLKASARVDLGQQGYSYSANLEGRQLNMEQALAALQPGFGGTISGRGQLSARITGAGTQQLRMRQNLSGTVRLAVEKGTMRGVNTLQVLSQQLNIPPVNRLDFVAASAEFEFRTGNSPRFVLLARNEQLRISARGEVGWQGQTEGNLTLHLQQSLSNDVPPEFLHKATIDANGWTVVESKVTGSVTQPEYSPPTGNVPGSTEP